MGLMSLQGDVPFSTTVINSTHNRTPECCIHGHTVCVSGYKQLRLGGFELLFCLHAARAKMIAVSLALMGTWLYCILQTRHMKPTRCCLRGCECGHTWGHCLFCVLYEPTALLAASIQTTMHPNGNHSEAGFLGMPQLLLQAIVHTGLSTL
jgi:hypothetical protein